MIATIEQERRERKKQNEKTDGMYAENARDRKKSEEKLTARDKSVQELDAKLKTMQTPIYVPVLPTPANLLAYYLDYIHLQELEDKLALAELNFEEEFAECIRNMQFEADDAAKWNINHLEGEFRQLKKELLKERSIRDVRKADSEVGL